MQSSDYSNYHHPQRYMMRPSSIVNDPANIEAPEEEDSDRSGLPDKRAGRRKIKIEYINDKSRRHITFSKRKAGIMKKAYELSTLTGTQVLLLVVSETGLVYTFTTPKLQPLVTKSEGKNLIQSCLNAPDPLESTATEPQDNASTTSPPMSKSSTTTYYQANQNLDQSANNSTYTKDRKLKDSQNFGNTVPTASPSLVLNSSNEPQMSTSFNPMVYSSYNSTQSSSTTNSMYPYHMQQENDTRYWNNNATNSLRHDLSKR